MSVKSLHLFDVEQYGILNTYNYYFSVFYIQHKEVRISTFSHVEKQGKEQENRTFRTHMTQLKKKIRKQIETDDLWSPFPGFMALACNISPSIFLIFKNGVKTWRKRSLGLKNNQMRRLLNLLTTTTHNLNFPIFFHLLKQNKSSNRTPKYNFFDRLYVKKNEGKRSKYL